jgi:hypothetical protein
MRFLLMMCVDLSAAAAPKKADPASQDQPTFD